MRWFKHEAEAGRSEAMRAVMEERGLEGYGLYFMVLEILARSAGGVDSILTLPAGEWARRCGLSTVKFKRVARVLGDHGLINLSELRSGRIMVARARPLETGSETDRETGMAGWTDDPGLAPGADSEEGALDSEDDFIELLETLLYQRRDTLEEVPDETIGELLEMGVSETEASEMASRFGAGRLAEAVRAASENGGGDPARFYMSLVFELHSGQEFLDSFLKGEDADAAESPAPLFWVPRLGPLAAGASRRPPLSWRRDGLPVVPCPGGQGRGLGSEPEQLADDLLLYLRGPARAGPAGTSGPRAPSCSPGPLASGRGQGDSRRQALALCLVEVSSPLEIDLACLGAARTSKKPVHVAPFDSSGEALIIDNLSLIGINRKKEPEKCYAR